MYKRISLALGILLLAFALFSALTVRQTTPDDAAETLLFDTGYGNRAIEQCVTLQDAVLPVLVAKTERFSHISFRQVGRLAEVLSRISTEKCRTLLKPLLDRECGPVPDGREGDPYTAYSCFFAKSIAAYALSKQGQSELVSAEIPFLLNFLKHGGVGEQSFMTEPAQGLCALALGHLGSHEAIEALLEALPDITGGRAPLEIVEALAMSRDKAAIEPLRALLASDVPGIPRTYEWADWHGERTLRALLLLEDYESISTLIEHVSHEMPDDYWVLQTLRKVSGQDLGNKQELWRAWWVNSGSTMKLSPQQLSDLLAEVKSEKRYWLENGLAGWCPWKASECLSFLP